MSNFDNFVDVITSVAEQESPNETVLSVAEALISDTYEGLEFVDQGESTIDEALSLSDLKVVKEKNGSGLSVKINGVEYRYVSDDKSPAQLLKTVQGMAKHNPGRALAWLKKNSVNYYGGKDKRRTTLDTKKSRQSKAVDEGQSITCPECGFNGNIASFKSVGGHYVCPECGAGFNSVSEEGNMNVLNKVGVLDEDTNEIVETTQVGNVGPYVRGVFSVGALYTTSEGNLAVVDNIDGLLTVVDDSNNVYTVESTDFNKLSPVLNLGDEGDDDDDD